MPHTMNAHEKPVLAVPGESDKLSAVAYSMSTTARSPSMSPMWPRKVDSGNAYSSEGPRNR